MAQATLDELRLVSEHWASIDDRLEMLGRVEYTLQEVLEAAVGVEALRETVSLAFQAEDEISLALQQTESSPLKLGATQREVRI
jgi:hypothetical protein